jgi:hypothetical protein
VVVESSSTYATQEPSDCSSIGVWPHALNSPRSDIDVMSGAPAGGS